MSLDEQQPSPPAPPDAIVLDWLLSGLCRRLYFSAEMGLLACLEFPADQFTRFVDTRIAQPMRALAGVLKLAGADHGAPAAAAPLDGVALWAEMVPATLLVLGEFRSLTAGELRDAVERFTGAWFTLRRCIEEAAAALGVNVSFLRGLPPAREQAFRSSLDALYDELRARRDDSGG